MHDVDKVGEADPSTDRLSARYGMCYLITFLGIGHLYVVGVWLGKE